jgi:hypothetical protein
MIETVRLEKAGRFVYFFLKISSYYHNDKDSSYHYDNKSD